MKDWIPVLSPIVMGLLGGIFYLIHFRHDVKNKQLNNRKLELEVKKMEKESGEILEPVKKVERNGSIIAPLFSLVSTLVSVFGAYSAITSDAPLTRSAVFYITFWMMATGAFVVMAMLTGVEYYYDKKN